MQVFFFFFFGEGGVRASDGMAWRREQRKEGWTADACCVKVRPNLSASPAGRRPAPAHRTQKQTVRHRHRALITRTENTSADMHVGGGAQSQVRTGQTQTTTRTVGILSTWSLTKRSCRKPLWNQRDLGLNSWLHEVWRHTVATVRRNKKHATTG